MDPDVPLLGVGLLKGALFAVAMIITLWGAWNAGQWAMQEPWIAGRTGARRKKAGEHAWACLWKACVVLVIAFTLHLIEE